MFNTLDTSIELIGVSVSPKGMTSVYQTPSGRVTEFTEFTPDLPVEPSRFIPDWMAEDTASLTPKTPVLLTVDTAELEVFENDHFSELLLVDGETILDLPSIDNAVYIAYFTMSPPNPEFPYSRKSWAGVNSLEDGILYSPGVYHVCQLMPRYLKPGSFRNFRTQRGKIIRIQVKDDPVVITRALDPNTLLPTDKYFLMPAWSLFDARTGLRFPYPKDVIVGNSYRKEPTKAEIVKELDLTTEYWAGSLADPVSLGIERTGISWMPGPWEAGDRIADVYLVSSRSTKIVPVFLGESGQFRTIGDLDAETYKLVLQAVSYNNARREALSKIRFTKRDKDEYEVLAALAN